MQRLFFSCDWGTTHFRLRVVDRHAARTLDELVLDEGVAKLSAGDESDRARRFHRVLASAMVLLTSRIEPDARQLDCVISGMASASIGWRELPYAPLPVGIDGQGILAEPLEPIAGPTGSHRVWLVSGLRSDTDIMRGEETQLVGLFQLPMAQRLAASCLVMLPGTHSKHVTIEDGQLVAFRTYMTGELFALLSEHSLLRHSLGPADDRGRNSPHDPAAFRAGVELARSVPLAAAAFRVRTRQVLDGMPATSNRAFLSGLLIGGELAELTRSTRSTVPLVLCADSPLAERYAEAAGYLKLADRLTVLAASDVSRLSCLGQARLLDHLEVR
jgi:2-dehydro-3-deoxygalactonokinase